MKISYCSSYLFKKSPSLTITAISRDSLASHHPLSSETVPPQTILYAHTLNLNPSMAVGYIQDAPMLLYKDINIPPQI